MRILFIILVTIIFVTSCYDNEETKTTITVDDPPKVIIGENRISGRVVSENNSSNTGLSINVNQSTLIPSHFNYFWKNGLNIGKYNEKFEITNSKGERFEYSISSIENDVNYIEISLFEYEETIFGFDRSQVWTMAHHKISYASNNSFEGQEQYKGDVKSKFRSFDINKVDKLAMIPNSRVGLRQDKSRGFLEMKDVFYFNATSTNNKKISLRNLEINDLKSDEALYIFNASLGVWEIVALRKSSKNALFDILESGFYCIGSVVNGVWVEGQLISNGQGLKHEKMVMKHANSTQIIHTTAKGQWLCYLPANSPVMVVIDNKCVVSSNSTISTSGQNMKNLIIEISDIEQVTISGTLKDCVGKDINNGILYLPIQDKFIFINNASFSTTVSECQGVDTDIVLMNATNGEILQKTTWKSLNKKIEMGEWWICSQFRSEYLLVNTEKSINELVIKSVTSIGTQRLSIYAENTTNNNQNITLILPKMPNVMIDDNVVNMRFTNLQSGNASFNFNCLTSTLGCGFESFEIKEFYKGDKKYYHGQFQGTFWVKDNNSQHAKNEKLNGHFIFESQ